MRVAIWGYIERHLHPVVSPMSTASTDLSINLADSQPTWCGDFSRMRDNFILTFIAATARSSHYQTEQSYPDLSRNGSFLFLGLVITE